VASATKRVDIAVLEMIKSALDNTFEGGIHSGGLNEGWVGCCRLPEEQAFWEDTFSFTHPTLAAAIIEKITEAKAKIISGEITVPTAY